VNVAAARASLPGTGHTVHPRWAADRPARPDFWAATLFVAFVAGAAGYLQLTRLLATAAVRSAYAWLAIRVVVWLPAAPRRVSPLGASAGALASGATEPGLRGRTRRSRADLDRVHRLALVPLVP